MNPVLERNLESLLKQAYHPALPRRSFRAALLAELLARLEGPKLRSQRRWPPAVAIAAALLIAVSLLTMAALEILRPYGSGPVQDAQATLDPGGVAQASRTPDDVDSASNTGSVLTGRSPLDAEDSVVPGPGPADLEGAVSPDPGVLLGRVVDAETGQPISRFVVWRRPERRLPEVAPAIPVEVDDAQGLFRIESVAPDRYALFVEAPGHAVWKLRDVQVEGGNEAPHEARLGRGSAVRGHVLDSETGAPVPGARVFAEFDLPQALLEIGGRYLERSSEASTLTDANGAYSLEHLSPGQHQLRASHPDHAPSWSATFELPAGELKVPFEVEHLMLGTGGRLAGRVERPDGTPWEGVQVIASLIAMERPQPVMAYGVGFTDGDGSYSIERMPEGYYVAMHQGDATGLNHTTVSNLRQISVRRGATTELDFVPLVGGSELSGVLADSDDRPLVGYTVYLNPDPLGDAFQDWIATPVTSEGRYRFQGVAPGSYDLYVAVDTDRMIWIRRLEVVGPGDLQVDLKLPQGSVSGTLRTTDGPVSIALVMLMRWDAERSDWAFHGKTGTQLDGNYEFAGLGPGRYRLSAIGLGPFLGSASPPAFQLREEEQHHDIVLVAGGSLRVEVRGESGKPLSAATVRLWDESGLELPFHAEAITAGDGRLRVPSLAGGTWTVIVTLDGLQEYRGSVEVLVGEESSLRVTLLPASRR